MLNIKKMVDNIQETSIDIPKSKKVTINISLDFIYYPFIIYGIIASWCNNSDFQGLQQFLYYSTFADSISVVY